MQPIVWLGVQFEVPAEWEILRHATRLDRGELAFADERQGRLHLAWAKAKGPPDVGRLLHDYRAKHLEQEPGSVFGELPHPGLLAGYRWRGKGGWVTRGGCYDAGRQRWMELTLAWPGGLDEGLERRIVESLRFVDEPRWCAFGLDVRYPAGWEVKHARAEVGLLTVRLAPAGGGGWGRAEATVRRYRATDSWYKGDARALVRREVAGQCEFAEEVRGGRRVVVGRGRQAGSGWRKLLGGLRSRTDVVWENERRRSVVQLTVVGGEQGGIGPEDFAIQEVEQEAGQ